MSGSGKGRDRSPPGGAATSVREGGGVTIEGAGMPDVATGEHPADIRDEIPASTATNAPW